MGNGKVYLTMINNFEEFLSLQQDQLLQTIYFEQYSWYQKIYIRLVVLYWCYISKLNKDIHQCQLWESMYKGRF